MNVQLSAEVAQTIPASAAARCTEQLQRLAPMLEAVGQVPMFLEPASWPAIGRCVIDGFAFDYRLEGSNVEVNGAQDLQSVWALIDRAAVEEAARTALMDRLHAQEGLTRFLIEVALACAGSGRERELLQAHLLDPRWSILVPLSVLELRPILGVDPRFELTVREALTTSGWARGHQAALQSDGGEGARSLKADLDRIVADVAGQLEVLEEVKQRKAPPLHTLQAQALYRLERVKKTLAGAKTLEVGSQDGGLLTRLLELGAEARAVDLAPRVQRPEVIAGDFLTAPLEGPFDAIVATAVFERGSWSDSDVDPREGNFTAVLLNRFRELLRPGGCVVLENAGFPLPFSATDADEAGFEVLDHRVPGMTLATGGRGCTLVLR